MKDVMETVHKELDAWKDIPLNICIIGKRGVGKSSLINKLRGITDYDPLAAPVDCVECTKECTSYQHPDNKNFLLWDVPGVGSPNFPQKTYLRAIEFYKYDLFLICTQTGYTATDIWLIDRIQKAKKRFCMLRTKIDIDIANEERIRAEFNEDETLEKIRRELNTPGNYKLFLVSSHFPDKWEFPLFQEQMIEDIPSEKREAILFSMQAHSKEFIEKKRKTLKTRINVVALASAAGGAIPVPGVSLAVDIPLILAETKFYRKQLCLDDKYLSKKAGEVGLTPQQLIIGGRLKLTSEILSGAAFVMGIAGRMAASELVEVGCAVVPIVGSAVAAGISYAGTNYTLRSILDQLCDESIQLVQFIHEKQMAAK